MKRTIGELLAENGQISLEELQSVQAESEKTGESMSMVLSRLGLADENQVKNVLELEYGVTYVSLKKLTPDMRTIRLVPENLITEHEAVPLMQEGNRLTLAMVTPSDQEALAAFKENLSTLQMKLVVCNEDDFCDFLSRANIEHRPQEIKKSVLPQKVTAGGWQDTNNILQSDQMEEDDQPEEPWEEVDDKAVSLICNHILNNAIAKGCTNIHIEPGKREILVHYRKDGVLFAARKLPAALLPTLVQRYKQMAAMSTADPKLPQDGHLNIQMADQELTLRLSIVAGGHGEHLIIWLQ